MNNQYDTDANCMITNRRITTRLTLTLRARILDMTSQSMIANGYITTRGTTALQAQACNPEVMMATSIITMCPTMAAARWALQGVLMDRKLP
ncbi:uncharacterized protein MELLADRAFT_91048 [Melampsora larici-populina 98AG31]|uniref:Uncharacterized protein n=1 Tax=Melampsora larici-populina (strain 98AG31 / pathotype 3-4-7) TaxID=747676 RepID=F4R8H7_MELLP|nr:uncharacterized protein MELLADRAFT_91048 [Melampsora larici-populina 98AG31]EGG11600.1 hypothetical protein MELLADRAFT_91048 [Melampsora larici-populina 98AG31]